MPFSSQRAVHMLGMSDERFRQIADQAQDLIYRYRIAPPAGFEYVNPACLAITGCTPAALYADPAVVLRAVHSDDRPLLESLLGAPDSLTGPITLRWIHQDGTMVWTEQQTIPIRDESGDVVALEAIARNVTERQRELAHMRTMQDEFVSRVSHELRTPLSAIKASIGVVLANEPAGTPDALHRLLTNIDLAAEQMNHMVANLLELARLTAGRVEIRRDRCDLRALVLQTVASVEPLARRRGQDVETALPEQCLALADPPRIERAVVNLLSNAVRYGPANGRIGVSLACDEREVVIAVSDNGPGVPAEERERIFERPDSSEPQSLSSAHGIGLGLAIARAMVELHGGRIWYEVPPEGGARFCIGLPLELQAAPPGPTGGNKRDAERSVSRATSPLARKRT